MTSPSFARRFFCPKLMNRNAAFYFELKKINFDINYSVIFPFFGCNNLDLFCFVFYAIFVRQNCKQNDSGV